MLKYHKYKEYKKRNQFLSAAFFVLSAALFAFVISKYDFTRLIFGEINQAKQHQEQSSVIEEAKTSQVAVEETTNNNTRPQQPESTNGSSIYRYVDDSGIIVMVSDLDRVPTRYRAKMRVLAGYTHSQNATSVIFRDNQVYVPVSIGYQGRTVNVQLLLDTGATGVIISPSIARKLGIVEASGRQNLITLADGSKINSYIVMAEHITVGPKSKKDIALQVIPREGSEESGLLGMSFLADFPHMIDTRSQVIKWM